MSTQKDKILDLLDSRGGWVSSIELNKIAFRYGAVIFDLRKEGYQISKKQVGKVWHYRLGEQPAKEHNRVTITDQGVKLTTCNCEIGKNHNE